MSNDVQYDPKTVSLKKLRKLIEQCLDNGDIGSSVDIDAHIRYWCSGVVRTRSKYDSMTKLWTVEFTTKDDDNAEYVYKFYAKNRGI